MVEHAYVKMMNERLAELLSTPVPKTLWHYTNNNALKSIVESGKMWATDVLYMNDREEFIHARKIVDRQLENLSEEENWGWVKQQTRKVFDSFFESGSLSDKRMQVFIVSFTTLEDSISQWDRYGDLSKGASLGFDLSGSIYL